MSKTFLYQINVTRDCNLRCQHCYIHSDVKAASKQMPLERFTALGAGIRDHMIKIGYDHAEIHIIGGEPTMLGVEYLQEALKALRGALDGHTFGYDLGLVSNLLTPDVVEIGRLFDHVTTSYEPETRFVSWNGKQKPGLEKKWLESVRKLQEDGVEVGVTTAITQPVIDYGASSLLDYFETHGIKRIHLGFFIPEGDGLVNKMTVFPSFRSTSQFLIEASRWYLQRRADMPDLWVNPFESMLAAMHRGEALDDIVCPITTGSMDINWDGNAVSCLEAGGATDPVWAGNVFEQGVLGVALSDRFIREVHEASKPNRHCIACDEYQQCRSGCGVLHRYWDPLLDDDCPGFKEFIKFVRSCYEKGMRPRYTDYVRKGC